MLGKSVGGHPYYYFVQYDADVDTALQELRAREFEAGRYNPAEPFPEFPLGPQSPSPGRQHTTIDEACEEAAEDGTRSILDIGQVGEEPDCGVAAPFAADLLLDLFRTLRPTRESVQASLLDLLTSIERGQCFYLVVSKDGRPSELFFAGYSYD
jgi:hypothetical protein